MHHQSGRKVFIALLLIASATSLLAQNQTSVSAPTATADPGVQRAKFKRSWNESAAVLRVRVANSSSRALAIEGVQTGPTLYLVSYPASVAPNSSDELVLRYVARPGHSGDRDIVRLLTNQGEREIEVAQERESAFVLESEKVAWTVGANPEPKRITLTLQQSDLRATGVRIFGHPAHQAKLRPVSNGRYTVEIIPASTKETAEFAVMVELTPAVPGNIPVIQCRVEPSS